MEGRRNESVALKSAHGEEKINLLWPILWPHGLLKCGMTRRGPVYQW
jgi:hypothetical protein